MAVKGMPECRSAGVRGPWSTDRSGRANGKVPGERTPAAVRGLIPKSACAPLLRATR